VTAPPPQESARVRLAVISVVVACLFAALFARLWFLTVVNAPKAVAAAANRGVMTIYTPAPRGTIYSSDGHILAGNSIAQVITVDRQQVPANPSMPPRLATLLGVPLSTLTAEINDLRYSSYAPVPVSTEATADQILFIREHQQLFPGVAATQESVRGYPLGTAAANIIGYVGQISPKEYTEAKADGNPGQYQESDQIGQAGVEATYERVLRGTPGVERVQVDPQGDVLGLLSDTPPVPGDNLVLTISEKLQTTAVMDLEAGLNKARVTLDPKSHRYFTAPAGAVVIQNPQNGDILALATNPDYDDNAFVNGISQKDFAALNSSSSNYPLNDRAIAGVYQPGSTFKLVTATAALQRGLITPQSTYDDIGYIKIGPETFKDDAGGAGTIALPDALTVSSDTFFYHLGAEFYLGGNTLGPDALQNVAKAYGFGSSSGVELPGEAPGLVPDAQVIEREHQQDPKDYPGDQWFEGNEVQMAIGEDQMQVTPLQLATAYGTFANGGTRYLPQIAARVERPNGSTLSTYAAQVSGHVPLTPNQHAAMLAGFEGVTADPSGTAYEDFKGFPLATIRVAGKTGTAQVSDAAPTSAAYKQTTSIFASFAPADNPQYAVTCFMEQSGYGADAAAPVVRSIYNTIFNLAASGSIDINTNGHD
jgi:penicillin-binding protein 2